MSNNFSARELFNNVINFNKSPRTLKWEMGYWGETVSRWYNEGLIKKGSHNIKNTDFTIGPALPKFYLEESEALVDTDVADTFNLDTGMDTVPYQFLYCPSFKKEIINENETYIESINHQGIKIRELKDNTSMPMWLEFPVKNRNDWEKIKEERLQINSLDKRFLVNKDKYIKEIKNREEILGILGGGSGFFGSLRFLMGEENLFLAYYDDPGLIDDMVNHLSDLWIAIAEELTSKIEFDLAYFWEDMSGKTGSLISPATFRQFMSPYYKKVIGFLKSRGMDKFVVDTDGNVAGLIPLFLETGINMMYPFERQADNDLIKYRKEYPDLVMTGGYDKNTLYKGKDAIDRELELMERLISYGGFIPYCDHLVPPNADWESFKYYRNKLNKIIDNTEVNPN